MPETEKSSKSNMVPIEDEMLWGKRVSEIRIEVGEVISLPAKYKPFLVTYTFTNSGLKTEKTSVGEEYIYRPGDRLVFIANGS
jgi:hypothetical protein